MPPVSCPACSRSMQIPDHLVGQRLRCPRCGAGFTLTARAPAPPPAPVPSYRPPAPPTRRLPVTLLVALGSAFLLLLAVILVIVALTRPRVTIVETSTGRATRRQAVPSRALPATGQPPEPELPPGRPEP